MKIALLSFLLLAAAAPLAAQRVPQAVITTGTSTLDSTGRPWVYVHWQVGVDVAADKVFAVYAKAGAPEDPGTFSLREVVRPAGTPQVLAALQSRAAALGRPPRELDEALGALYSHLGGTGSPPADQQFAAVLQHSRQNRELAALLQRSSRQRPALAMALGRAWAGAVTSAIGSPVTVELREWNDQQNAAGGVVGRITVAAGQAAPLPAPGRPVQVKDASIAGDRIIRLRWAAPDALRLAALKSNGVNVWRVDRAAAEVRNWHLTPPPAAHLVELEQQAPSLVARVTPSPVTPGKLFTDADVDPATGNDRQTSYVDDSNGANLPSGVPFADGASFYYFAAAADLLGRPGLVSPAGQGTACVTLPPAIPRLEVDVDYQFPDPALAGNLRHPAFVCSWAPNANDAEDFTTHYELYRGVPGPDGNTDLADLSDPVRQAALVPFAVVPHPAAAVEKMSQADARTLPLENHVGKGYWFAIRAVREQPWGRIVSQFSPPVLASIRDTRPMTAPAAETVGNIPNCPRISVIAGNLQAAALSAAETGRDARFFRAVCERTNPGVLWAEFHVTLDGTEVMNERLYFAPEEDFTTVELDFTLAAGSSPVVTCRAGSDLGAISPAPDASLTFSEPSAGQRTIGRFQARALDDAGLQWGEPFTTPLLGSAVNLSAPSAVDTGIVRASIDGGAGEGSFLVVGYQNFFDFVTAGHGFAKAGVLHFYDPLAVAGQPTRNYFALPIRGAAGPGACQHVLEDPSGSGSLRPVAFRFPLTPGTRQYRIWRRVDGGTLELMDQAPADFDPAAPNKEFVWRDIALPPSAVEISYFAQLSGRDGNDSPMILLGTIIPAHPLPRPVLATPESVLVAGIPHMRLTWTCPPAGVTQFEISMKGDPPPQNSFAPPVWAINFAGPPPAAAPGKSTVHHVMRKDLRVAEKLTLDDRERILTKPIGNGLTDDPPESGKFSLDIPVTKGMRYMAISIRAVGGTATTFGAASNVQAFTWRSPPQEEQVAWPARPLPPVQEFKARYQSSTVLAKAALLNYIDNEKLIVPQKPAGQSADETGPLRRPGVLVGQTPAVDIRFPKFLIDNGRLRMLGSLFGGSQQIIDPHAFILARDGAPAEKLLPVALYRRAASTGKLMQVTPMLEKIAWQQSPTAGAATVDGILHDPYLGVTEDGSTLRLYLLDTQPATAGETYQYLLIRFDPVTKEMLETIDAGQLLIPE